MAFHEIGNRAGAEEVAADSAWKVAVAGGVSTAGGGVGDVSTPVGVSMAGVGGDVSMGAGAEGALTEAVGAGG